MPSLPPPTTKALPSGDRPEEGPGPASLSSDRETAKAQLESLVSPRGRLEVIKRMQKATPDPDTLDELATFFRSYLGAAFVEQQSGFLRALALMLPTAPGAEIVAFLRQQRIPDDTIEVFQRTWGIDPGDTETEEDDLAGLEETPSLLAEAAQGPGVVVVEREVLAERAGLEALVKRLPPGLTERVIVFRDGDLSGLAATLMASPYADRVTYVGLEEQARRLHRLLPASLPVSYLPPTAGLEQIVLALGIPREVVEQVLPAGLEESLTLGRAA